MIKVKNNNKFRGQFDCDNVAQFDYLYEQLEHEVVKFGANRTRTSEMVCPISPIGSFLAGNVFDFKRLLPDIEIEQSFLNKHFPHINFKANPEIKEPNNTDWTYRQYQKDAIIAAYKMGRGIIDSPTASGKSIIMYGIIENLPQFKKGKTLILVPTPGLVSQLCSDFKKYGHKSYGAFYSKAKVCPDTDVIISCRSHLRNHHAELPKISHLIIDEVHKLSKKSVYEQMIKRINTKSVFGMTATMPEEIDESWYIKGMVGPVIAKEHAHELQEQNYLAKIYILSLKFKHKTKPLEVTFLTEEEKAELHATELYSREYHYLESHHASEDYIAQVVDKLKGNTLILFDHTVHGKNLEAAIDGNIVYIDGKVDIDDRNDIKELLEESDNLKLLAQSTCFGTGESVNNIQNLVICSHTKRLTKIIQQVGRGLRKTRDGDEYLTLVDVHHDFKYSSQHFSDRTILYKKFYNNKYDKQVEIPI